MKSEKGSEKPRSRSRKVIKKILKRKLPDGTWVPIEITRTVIERDGNKSVTRQTFDENQVAQQQPSVYYSSGNVKTLKHNDSLVISGLEHH